MKNDLPIFISMFLLFSCNTKQEKTQDQQLVDSPQNKLGVYNENKISKGEIRNSLKDSGKVEILLELSRSYYQSNTDTALDKAMEAHLLSKQIGYKVGIANANIQVGYISKLKGNYSQAYYYYGKAMEIFKEAKNENGLHGLYYSLGCLSQDEGNFPQALKYYLEGMAIAEKTGNKSSVARCNNNIGLVYQTLGNYIEALDRYKANLIIYQELNDKDGIASTYENLGTVYIAQGDYFNAMNYIYKGLKGYEEIGSKYGIANSYNSLGLIYYKKGNYPEAIKNQVIALKLHKENGYKYEIAITLIAIGKTYEMQGNLEQALNYESQARSIANEIGAKNYLRDVYENLSNISVKMGNFRNAYHNHVLLKQMSDSIFNNENTRKLTQAQMQYDFDKKEELTKAEQEKKDAIAQKEMQKQKLVLKGFIGGFAVVLLFAVVFFRQRNKTKKEKKYSDELLLNILPEEVAEELKSKGSADAKQFDEVTVLFTDFKDFTRISETMTPKELVEEIHSCFKAFDTIIEKYGIEKIKTIGDSYMCAGGLPVANTTHAMDVVNAAIEIQSYILNRISERIAIGKEPFHIRIGINTGPVVAGIVGIKKYAYDIWGDTVNLASRMESSGEAGKINISGTTYEFVKNKFKCVHRGKIQVKGKGELDMYYVEEGI